MNKSSNGRGKQVSPRLSSEAARGLEWLMEISGNSLSSVINDAILLKVADNLAKLEVNYEHLK